MIQKGNVAVYKGLFLELPSGHVIIITVKSAYKGGKESVTAHPGCGPGESVALCLNILSH